jgi:hypothetical protein
LRLTLLLCALLLTSTSPQYNDCILHIDPGVTKFSLEGAECVVTVKPGIGSVPLDLGGNCLIVANIQTNPQTVHLGWDTGASRRSALESLPIPPNASVTVPCPGGWVMFRNQSPYKLFATLAR